MKFKRSSNVLFLDPHEKEHRSLEKSQNVDLILSPSLYWVKKIKLPVKSVREVKKLLPSIFEDSLPFGNYSYSAYKYEDEFFVFAYEDKKIIDLLSERGIAFSAIKSIHFAQSEFEKLESALKINQTQSIYVKDSVLVVVPSTWLSKSDEMVTLDLELSKHTLKLQQFSHIVDNSSLYKIGGVLAVFVVVLLVEIFVASSKRDAIIEAKDGLFSHYKLQSTMFQNKSTLSKYTKIHTKQMRLRELVAIFLNLHLKQGEKISLMEYKNSVFIVKFSNLQKDSSSHIVSLLKSKKIRLKESQSSESMHVEITI